MARADKAAAVAELTESFRQSTAAVLTEYRGLTVAQLKELRRTLAADARYAVVKNTLTKIAVRDAGVTELEPLLEGPSAIAFVTGDPVVVAKGIRDFAKAHPALVVKGGILDGRSVTPDEIRKLADLESREVLLAKLAGGFLAPAQQFASVLAASLSQVARLLAALEAKAQADPSILGGGAGEPAAAAATDEPVATEESAASDEPVATDEPAAAASEEPAATDESAASDEPTAPAAETPGPSAQPSDGPPGTEELPETAPAEAADDPGGAAQAVADDTDIPPTTDAADDATSTS